MLLKIIGALVAIWLVFMVLGFVLKAIGTLVIIGIIATAGVVGYNAIKGRQAKRQIR